LVIEGYVLELATKKACRGTIIRMLSRVFRMVGRVTTANHDKRNTSGSGQTRVRFWTQSTSNVTQSFASQGHRSQKSTINTVQ